QKRKVHIEVECPAGYIRSIGGLEPVCKSITPNIVAVKGTSNRRILQHLSHRPAITAGKDGIKLIRKKGIVSAASAWSNAFRFVINGQSLRYPGWDGAVKGSCQIRRKKVYQPG